MNPDLRWRRVILCLIAGVVFLGASAARAQSTVQDLYAITTDKKLLRVDTGTGAGTLVAILSVDGDPYGLASMKMGHGESAELWAVTTANRLYRVDPYTGKVLLTNVTAFPAASGGGLAWRQFFSSDIFVAQKLNSTGTLVRMDYSAGTSVVVGALSPPMEGLEINYNGTLFGLSASSSPALYVIDSANGATTLIGSLGISVPGFNSSALAMYGGVPGETYAAVGSSSESRLYELDGTGAAALRGQIGFSRVSGLAFHVRQPGPLSVRRIGTNVIVSWPETNGGYLWKRTNVTSFGTPVFNTTFPATNRFEMFYLSPFPPF